jgi:hypothetical protein
MMKHRMRRACWSAVCALVLLSWVAEAGTFKSRQDLLESGDNAAIAALEASSRKAGSARTLQPESAQSVFVFTFPNRYVPYGAGGNLVAWGIPDGGTFSWSFGPSGDTAHFPGDALGTTTVSVTYTLNGASDTADAQVTVFACDVDIDGVADGDPEDPSGADTDPGAVIGPIGPRKAITLRPLEAAAFPVSQPADGHFWTVTLTPDPGGIVQFWDAAQGGNQLTQLSWAGNNMGHPWHGDTVPANLYAQAASTGSTQVKLHAAIDDHSFVPTGAYDDTVLLKVAEARLDADNVDDAVEEDPGVSVGVGGTKLMRVRMPLYPVPGEEMMKLSWTNADKVHVWSPTQEPPELQSGQTIAFSDLSGEGVFAF